MAERARISFPLFVRQAWHTVEPGTRLRWTWHVQAICEHLQAVTDGEIRKLLINIPPGHMKSLLVAVFWPAWVWLEDPSWRVLFGSYDQGLSTRDSVRCRDVIQSDWYQGSFRPEWKMKTDQNVKTWFENDVGGLRMALSVSGQARGTGFRGHAVVFDDPLNVKQSPTTGDIEECKFWWDNRMSTRLNEPETGIKVGIMQRVHEDDLSGHLAKKGGYTRLCLPTEFDPEKRCETEIGFVDPRTEKGELLFPEIYTQGVIDEAREDLGPLAFECQHNQNPGIPGGTLFKDWWWRFWYPAGMEPPPPVVVAAEDGTPWVCPQVELPSGFERQLSTSDLAMKDKATSDLVAIQIWGVLDVRRFLLDQVLDRLSFVNTIAAYKDLLTAHEEVSTHLIEDKANGPAVINVLESKLPGLLPIEPRGSKTARAEACSPQIQAGKVYLPHPSVFPWVAALLVELSKFPRAPNDDQVDALTQLLNYLVKPVAEWSYSW